MWKRIGHDVHILRKMSYFLELDIKLKVKTYMENLPLSVSNTVGLDFINEKKS